MAKAKYFTQNNEKVYPISHTKAVYDGNGKVLEDRLTEDETAISSLQTDVKGKADKTDVDNKLNSNSVISDTTVAFTEASVRENIVSNEKSSTLFGKVQKWFSDLKKVAFTGSYNDLTDIPSNQIFVQCDGDHDELKLQTAISAAPYNSVIYPVGTQCVLTNENIIPGYGSLISNGGGAIISLKGGMTLDGSMCDEFIFKNTNPAEKQHIFHISQFATMKNVTLVEDTKTVTSDTINPIVLYAEDDSNIMFCSFVTIFSTHQIGVSTFKLGKVLFFNNVIDGFEGAPGNAITKEIYIARYAKIIGNELLDFTQNKPLLGFMLSATNIFFQYNYIETCDNCLISLGGSIMGNIFRSMEDCSISCGGEIIGNIFMQIHQNENESFLTNSGRLIGNQFTGIYINGEYVQFIDCSNSSIISDNYMSITSIPATGSCSLIGATGKTLILNNTFSTSSSLADNNEFNLLDVDGNTVIKNNVTSAKSFGRIADTCIAEGNITSWS